MNSKIEIEKIVFEVIFEKKVQVKLKMLVKDYLTMSDIYLIVISVIFIFVLVVGAIIYQKATLQDYEIISLINTGDIREEKDFKVYEFDGKLIVVNLKENIVLHVNENQNDESL